jgi:hypothetical protein
MTDFEALLGTLDRNRVEYIVAGGVAALAHGSARFTQDLDIVYNRSPENLERLALAFRDLKPYLRGAPPGLPFVWDRVTLSHGLNFTLETSLGPIDLLGEIPGGGTYADLVDASVELRFFAGTSKCLSLEQLIRAKRATGRRRRELEVLREEASNGAAGP